MSPTYKLDCDYVYLLFTEDDNNEIQKIVDKAVQRTIEFEGTNTEEASELVKIMQELHNVVDFLIDQRTKIEFEQLQGDESEIIKNAQEMTELYLTARRNLALDFIKDGRPFQWPELRYFPEEDENPKAEILAVYIDYDMFYDQKENFLKLHYQWAQTDEQKTRLDNAVKAGIKNSFACTKEHENGGILNYYFNKKQANKKRASADIKAPIPYGTDPILKMFHYKSYPEYIKTEIADGVFLEIYSDPEIIGKTFDPFMRILLVIVYSLMEEGLTEFEIPQIAQKILGRRDTRANGEATEIENLIDECLFIAGHIRFKVTNTHAFNNEKNRKTKYKTVGKFGPLFDYSGEIREKDGKLYKVIIPKGKPALIEYLKEIGHLYNISPLYNFFPKGKRITKTNILALTLLLDAILTPRIWISDKKRGSYTVWIEEASKYVYGENFSKSQKSRLKKLLNEFLEEMKNQGFVDSYKEIKGTKKDGTKKAGGIEIIPPAKNRSQRLIKDEN